MTDYHVQVTTVRIRKVNGGVQRAVAIRVWENGEFEEFVHKRATTNQVELVDIMNSTTHRLHQWAHDKAR